MKHNRIRSAFEAQSAAAQPVQQVRSEGLVMVPIGAQQLAWQVQLYQMAYQQALVDLAPPVHDRRFFSSWN